MNGEQTRRFLHLTSFTHWVHPGHICRVYTCMKSIHPTALCLLVFVSFLTRVAPLSVSFAGGSASAAEPHATSPQQVSSSVTEIVDRLQARYEETQGFQADFRQEIESATLGQKVTSHGVVSFKKPGRMRWEFTDPAQLLVSDGTFFWFYQPAEQQVVRTPFQQAFRSTTPVSFLTGVGRLDTDFQISLLTTNEDVHVLSLTPKHDADSVGSLVLEVSLKTFDIVQAVVTDPLGNITRLQFSNINRDALLKDSLFRFTIPPGVDLVEPYPQS